MATTLRECSNCNSVHGEPRDRRCPGAATGSLFEETQLGQMEQQETSQLILAQASNVTNTQETLISEDTVLDTIRQVEHEKFPETFQNSTGACANVSTDTLMLKALKDLTGKFTEFEARAVASDRLVSQLTERIELQQQTIVNLSESVKKGKPRGNSARKVNETIVNSVSKSANSEILNNNVCNKNGAKKHNSVTYRLEDGGGSSAGVHVDSVSFHTAAVSTVDGCTSTQGRQHPGGDDISLSHLQAINAGAAQVQSKGASTLTHTVSHDSCSLPAPQATGSRRVPVHMGRSAHTADVRWKTTHPHTRWHEQQAALLREATQTASTSMEGRGAPGDLANAQQEGLRGQKIAPDFIPRHGPNSTDTVIPTFQALQDTAEIQDRVNQRYTEID